MSSSSLHADGRLYLEDLAPGQTFVSRKLLLDAEAIARFAGEFDPQPFHTDPAAAQSTFFGGLAASGWHTAALTMRLMVDCMPIAGGLIGAGGEISWPRPTRPGDILEADCEVLEVVPSRSRPDRGSIRVRIITRNERGEVLQRFEPRLLVFRRQAAPE